MVDEIHYHFTYMPQLRNKQNIITYYKSFARVKMFIVFNVRFRFPTKMPLLIQFIVGHQMNQTAFTKFGLLVAGLKKITKSTIQLKWKRRRGRRWNCCHRSYKEITQLIYCMLCLFMECIHCIVFTMYMYFVWGIHFIWFYFILCWN